MELKIVTPEGVVFENLEAKSITLPTSEGIITVLEDHIPLVTPLASGEIEVKSDKEIHHMAVSKGIVEIRRGSRIYILADTAEREEEIDLDRAEAARQKAIEYLEKSDTVSPLEVQLLQAKIEKEMARINVGKKYRKLTNIGN